MRDRMAIIFFVEGGLLPGSNDLRPLSSGLRHLLSFHYLALYAPEGADGPVGFEPVAGKCGVMVMPSSSASGLVTAVDID